ncbi:MAG: hypothetical protein O3B64_03580 [bacterium]|nr:hypothetical protein [bacterium]
MNKRMKIIIDSARSRGLRVDIDARTQIITIYLKDGTTMATYSMTERDPQNPFTQDV